MSALLRRLDGRTLAAFGVEPILRHVSLTTLLRWILRIAATAVVAALALAGAYAETHRAPDQP